MSVTTEVPREEWPAFCDHFSRVHEGWQVRVEQVGGPDPGGVEASRVPLSGVVATLRASGDEIALYMTDVMTHPIPRPTHLYLKQSDEGDDETLCVTSADGTSTMVTFRRV